MASMSSSYAEYLREIALETNGTISREATAAASARAAPYLAARTTVAVPHTRSSHRASAAANAAGVGHTPRDPSGDVYDYCFLQAPPMGSVSRACAVRQYEQQHAAVRTLRRNTQAIATNATTSSGAGGGSTIVSQAPRDASTLAAPVAAHLVRASTVTCTSARRSVGALRDDGSGDRDHAVSVKALQRSFQRLYASMQDEGRRSASLQHTGPQPRRASSSRPSQPQRHTHRAQVAASAGAIRIPDIDYDTYADDVYADEGMALTKGHHGAVPLSRPCPHHTTASASRECTHAKSAMAHSSSSRRATSAVKVVSPVMTSTDSSAITCSPTRDGDRGAGPAVSSSASSVNTSRTDAALHEAQRRGRHAAAYRCPHCCHRCDSCHCTGRPCQTEAHEHRQRQHQQRRALRSASASSDVCVTRHSPYHGAVSRDTARAQESVRLQWPGQPSPTTSATSSRRPSPLHEARAVPSRTPSRTRHRSRSAPKEATSARHHRRHHRPHASKRHVARGARHGDGERHALHTTEAVVSSTATAATTKSTREATARGGKEAVLRDVAARTCACYWADFPDLPMAVNPAAHAATCPYQAHEALYTEVVLEPSSDSSTRHSCSESSCSRSSSSSSSSSTSTTSRGRQHRETRRTSARGRQRGAPLSGRGQSARRPRSALKDAEVTLPRARAAVIGSTKRRTYMEMLMDAARDAPAAPSSSSSPAAASPPPPHFTKDPQRTGEPPASASASTSAAAAAVGGSEVPEDTQDKDDTAGDGADGTAAAAAKVQDAPQDTAARAQEDTAAEAPSTTEAAEPSAAPTAKDGDVDAAYADLHQAEPEHTRAAVSPLRALSRPRPRPRRGVPGPGAYHVDEAFAMSSAGHGPRGAAMAKAPRMPHVRATTPGPGAYDVYKHEEEERRAVVVTAITVAEKAGSSTAAVAAGGPEAADGTHADPTAAVPVTDGAAEPTAAAASAGVKTIIGKGVAFASTSGRQLQLQYGDAYVRAAAWVRRATAVPGPGAYNFVEGDRVDQSRAPGTARQGFRFPKSADGAHFTGAPPVVAAAPASPETPAAGDAQLVPGARAAAAAAVRASLVLPWRDWAGGSYIGTSTAAFVAHPSLATRDRRVAGQPAEDEDQLALRSGGAAWGTIAAANVGEGGVWKGVGSGVALRLTSQRFPAAPADDAGDDDEDGGAVDAPRGKPGPASYETESGLRWVQRRAPAANMVFRPRDRGPRGPLRSLTASSAVADDASSGAAAAASVALASLPLFASPSPFLYGDSGRLAPGPGTYDVDHATAALLRRGPQWSLGTATVRAAAAAAADASLGLPGPGAYDAEAAYRALLPAPTSALLGTAPRFQQPTDPSRLTSAGAEGVEELITGPGTYDVESGLALVRPRVKGGVVPRAGAADGAPSKEAADEASPGPGAYTLPVLHPTAPTALLGSTAPRFPWERAVDVGVDGADPYDSLQQDISPGPGAYDIDAAATLANRPGVIIGTAPRGLLAVPRSEDAGLGPGSYSLPALPAGRAALMLTAPAAASGGVDGGRVVGAAAAAAGAGGGDGPGPGLYDPVDPRAAAPRGFSLARTSQRFVEAPAGSGDVPGPGAYEVGARGPWMVQSSPGGVAFSTAPRFADAAADRHQSDTTGALFECGVGIGGALTEVVGPGSYDPRYPEGPLAPSYSIARAPRFPTSGQQDADGVGPGTYEVVDLSPPTRGAVMGTSAARDAGGAAAAAAAAAGREVPGPGAYSLQYTQVEATAPRVLLGRAPTERGSEMAMTEAAAAGVGPGQYDPQYRTDVVYAAPGYTFGTAPRAGVQGDTTAVGGPGPGAYEASRTRDGHLVSAAAAAMAGTGGGGYGGPTFGTAPRLAEGSAAAAGGGGAGGSGGQQLAAGPGPGAYMPEVGLEWLSTSAASPAARFGTAPRMLGDGMPGSTAGGGAGAAAGGPGPGAYEPNMGLLYPTVPSVGFARAHNTGVGGGTAAAADTPGPGAYMATELAEGATHGVRAAQFGSAPRFTHSEGASGALDLDGPGPNMYAPVDHATRPAVPSHRFGTAPRAPHSASPDAEAAGTGAAGGGGVGPGAYDIATGLARSSQWATPAAFTFPRAAAHVDATGVAGQGAGDAAAAAAPGPGAYSVEAAYRATLPHTAAAPFATAPGHPRADQATEHGGSGTSAGGGGGESGIASSPGPGAYELPPTFPAGPSWGFGTAARQAGGGGPADASGNAGGGCGAAVDSTMPGPGAYALPPPPPLHSGVSFPHAASNTTANAATAAATGAATPGPGAYDVADALVRPGVRSVGFGTGAAGPVAEMAAEAIPGPGAYSPNLHASSMVRQTPAGPSFATAPRLVDADGGEVAGGVGPGSYDPRAAGPSSGAPRFGSAPRLTDPTTAAATGSAAGCVSDVGPGSYSIDAADALVRPRAPAHHMAMSGAAQRQASAISVLDAYPGPGSYANPVEVHRHARAALMLGRHPEQTTAAAAGTPGPGAYDVAAASTATHPAVPALTFGTASTQRAPAVLDDVPQLQQQPGPGAYDVAAAFFASQVARVPGGFTMQGRTPSDALAEGPGPGAYDVTGAGAALSAAAHRFGTAPRMPPSDRAADGAGETVGGSVGPGAYDVPLPLPSHAPISFPHAPRALGGTDGQREAFPGPGAYDISAARTQGTDAPSFTIPRGARPELRHGDADASPLVGPGTYSPVDAAAMRYTAVQPGPSAAFGLAERPAGGGPQGVPGPGTYDPHAPATAGIGFGTAPRMDALEPGSSTTPGPGAYDASPSTAATGAAASGVRFGKAPRPSLADANDNPGPGSYSPDPSAGGRGGAAAAASFGSAARPDVLLNTNPGPGTYDVGWTGAADAPGRGGVGFGLALRSSPVLNTNPGPGTYDRASDLGGAYGPSFGIGERMSAVHGAGTPGPGAYYTIALDNAAGLGGPMFALAERPGPERNAYPGPGSYYRDRLADASRGVGFGFGERASPVCNDNPGPGTYFQSASGVFGGNATGARGLSCGTAERPHPKLNDNPGPGTYHRDTPPPPPALTTQPASTPATRVQPPRRPSAADTLRKLASVGYPTQEPKSSAR